LSDFTVSADEAASGQVQRVKLAYSGDGLDTHITADASGLLVNLGTNNDVTVTSGTVTVGGTVSALVTGGTVTVGTLPTLTAGTAYVGSVLIGNATDRADMLALTNGTALAVGLYNGSGDQVTLPDPITVGGTVTNGTAVYAAGDTMGTVVALSGFESYGDIKGARLFDPSDQGQDIYAWVFRATVTPSADNAAFSLADSDLIKTVGVIQFTDYFDAALGQVSIGKLTPVGHPQAYLTSAGTAFVVLQSQGTGTYATASISFELDVQPIA
jgi:hypothetical protein